MAAVALAVLVGIFAVYAFPSPSGKTVTSVTTSTAFVTSSEVTTSVTTATSVVTTESTVTQQVTSTTTILTVTVSTTSTAASTTSLTTTVQTTSTMASTTAPCTPLGPAICGVNVLNASLIANETAPHSSQASAYLNLTIVNTGNVQITWLNVTLSGTPAFYASMTWLPGTSVTLSLPIPAGEIQVNQGQTYQLVVSTDTAIELVNLTAT